MASSGRKGKQRRRFTNIEAEEELKSKEISRSGELGSTIIQRKQSHSLEGLEDVQMTQLGLQLSPEWSSLP